jgi:hypothetical protein
MLIPVDLSWPAIDALDGGDPETEHLEATSSRITDLENTSMPYLAFIWKLIIFNTCWIIKEAILRYSDRYHLPCRTIKP